MNKIIYYVSITLLTVVSSCGNKETNVSRKLTLDNCPVIAQVINLQGDPVTNLDFSSVKDTFNLPLSSLLSSFQVIRLENSEDALTAAGQDTNIVSCDECVDGIVHQLKQKIAEDLSDSIWRRNFLGGRSQLYANGKEEVD